MLTVPLPVKRKKVKESSLTQVTLEKFKSLLILDNNSKRRIKEKKTKRLILIYIERIFTYGC